MKTNADLPAQQHFVCGSIAITTPQSIDVCPLPWTHPVFCMPAAQPFIVMIRVSETAALYGSSRCARSRLSSARTSGSSGT